MREDAVYEFCFGSFKRFGDREALNELRYLRADRINTGLIGLAPLIDDDAALLDFDLGTFQPDILDIPNDPDRKDHAIHRCFVRLAALLDGCNDATAVLL